MVIELSLDNVSRHKIADEKINFSYYFFYLKETHLLIYRRFHVTLDYYPEPRYFTRGDDNNRDFTRNYRNPAYTAGFNLRPMYIVCSHSAFDVAVNEQKRRKKTGYTERCKMSKKEEMWQDELVLSCAMFFLIKRILLVNLLYRDCIYTGNSSSTRCKGGQGVSGVEVRLVFIFALPANLCIAVSSKPRIFLWIKKYFRWGEYSALRKSYLYSANAFSSFGVRYKNIYTSVVYVSMLYLIFITCSSRQ